MGNAGRFACVAVPFALTLAALIALLVATLSGVTDKNLYMFRVNLSNLQVSPASIIKLVNGRDVHFHDPRLLAATRAQSTSSGGIDANQALEALKGTNLTASDLGLADLYDITLWGYCSTTKEGVRECTKGEFNWAEKELGQIKDLSDTANTLLTTLGQKVTVPKEVNDAITTFSTVTRWTEVAFIVANVALGVELFFGLFAGCSRALSCVTFLFAGLATVAVCGAAAMATAMSVVVVGAVETTAKFYGVKAEFNTRFLATIWIAAAFAIAAGFFWLFTICCCAPDHSSRRSNKHHLDAYEKQHPVGAYHPLQDNHGYPAPAPAPQYGYASNLGPSPRRDLAYEPYSHGRV